MNDLISHTQYNYMIALTIAKSFTGHLIHHVEQKIKSVWKSN